jgi:type II secretory pathway component PulK
MNATVPLWVAVLFVLLLVIVLAVPLSGALRMWRMKHQLRRAYREYGRHS